MSQVFFILDGKQFCAQPGDRLLDVLDEAEEHALPIACRAANCGVCRVAILEGGEALEPPMAAEVELLSECSAQRNERLGCQVCVTQKPSVHRVRLRRV